MNWGVLIQVLGLVGGVGGLTAILMIPSQLKKLRADTDVSEADAAAKLSAAAVAMLSPANEELERLQNRLTNMITRTTFLEEQLRSAQAEVASLTNQVAIMSKELDWYRKGEFGGR